MLCFGVPKTNGDPASAPAEVHAGSVRPRHSRSPSGSGQPEFIKRSKQLAQELKDMLLHIGVQPTVVARDSLVINMECIQEEKSGLVRAELGSSTGQHQACTAIPELADGTKNGSSVPRRPRTDSPRLPPASAHPPRSFVRVQSIHHQLPGSHADPPGGSRTPSASPSSFSIADRIIEDVREEEDEPSPSPGEQPTPSKRGLNWTASRRALAVLVVREEHLSRTDKGLQNLSHSRRLEDRLERLNLDMLTMDGDGNCQFRTLAHELYGSQEHHPQVRARVMQHIKDNKEEYECFLGEDFGTYVTSMSRSRTWGDELTLRAACDAYGIMVCVVTSDAQKWFLTYEPKVLDESHGGGELFLAYIAPIHYNAIRRKATLRTLSKQLSSSFKRLAMSGSLHT